MVFRLDSKYVVPPFFFTRPNGSRHAQNPVYHWRALVPPTPAFFCSPPTVVALLCPLHLTTEDCHAGVVLLFSRRSLFRATRLKHLLRPSPKTNTTLIAKVSHPPVVAKLRGRNRPAIESNFPTLTVGMIPQQARAVFAVSHSQAKRGTSNSIIFCGRLLLLS